MSTKDLPSSLTISLTALIKRMGWLRWQGMQAEYGALVSLLPRFEPDIRIDDLEQAIVDEVKRLEILEDYSPSTWA